MMMIKTSVLETYSESNMVSYDMICSEFGKPKDIIISYFAEADDEELYKRICFSRTIRTGAACIVAVVIAVAVFKSALIYVSYKKSVDAIITKEVTVIE